MTDWTKRFAEHILELQGERLRVQMPRRMSLAEAGLYQALLGGACPELLRQYTIRRMPRGEA